MKDAPLPPAPPAEAEAPEVPPADAAPPRRPSRVAAVARLFNSVEGSDVVAPAPVVPLREVFRFFWPYARPYRGLLALMATFIVLAPLAQAAALYMIKVIVDEVLEPQALSPFAWIAPLLIGLTLLAGALKFASSFVSAYVGQRFVEHVRTDLFAHLQTLSLEFFERRRLGDILSRLTADIGAIQSLVVASVANVGGALVTLVFFTGALFYLDWQLAIVALLLAPAFLVISRIFSRLMKRATREKGRRAGAMTAVAEESISNVSLVQAYNRQGYEAERFGHQVAAAFEAALVTSRIRALFQPVVDVVQAVAAVAVLAVGTLALADGRLTLGGLLVFVAYLNQLFGPMRTMAGIYNTLYSASASAERVIEFFRATPAITDRPGARDLGRAHGEVELDGVWFRYPGTTRHVLEDLSLRVEPGETLALVGRSGAGKSTIAKLLLRFYDPDEGAVRIDGIDLRDLQVKSLRDNVALLLQDSLIFDGTVAENIAYGRPGASREEIVDAARQADAHDFVSTLPDGYDTPVGQKGRRLSGGQQQRVAIARAMIRDAPVLILDEPTTGLDIESGQKILEPLRRLMSGRATIIITHSLTIAREATSLLVLDHGRAVERGSHAELLARDGRYAELWQLHQAGQRID